MKLAPNIFAIKTMVGNQYLIVDGNVITLIDTGLRGNHRRIVAEMNSLGLSLQQLNTILITHADGDHAGSLNALQALVSVNAGASQAEAAAIQAGKPSRLLRSQNIFELWLITLTTRIFRIQASQINTILEPESSLPIRGGLQVLDTAGHTPGHLSFYLPDEQILFAGDSIWSKNGKPSPSSVAANTWDLHLAKQTFERQMDLPLKIIAAGHCIFRF